MREEAKQRSHNLTAGEVRDYLKANPDFLATNPDLLQVVTPPAQNTGDNVLDFQRFMVERLQADVSRLDEFHGVLLATSRTNLVSQQQIHEAALAAMEAVSLNHLVHIVTGDWVDMLGVDAVALCLESPASQIHGQSVSGLTLIRPGLVNDLLGAEGAIMLRDDVTAPSEIFGPATPLVRAEALVALESAAVGVPGLLAFGSRDPESFVPGQGTELLRFLALTLERMLKLWLKLAP